MFLMAHMSANRMKINGVFAKVAVFSVRDIALTAFVIPSY
ncbi:hypothetical protein SAMN05421779_10171 [Insolitispirillum peregrinum]|uniref:Uncharacterized protein n=1 Tax=Insolitispirillum peregrinum TaxID=80876 RepID=A0A1N7II39_9PROT|nr:hypothetical protein SAMN05421779_10171 [Insolitispirillum peregrinum]